jgi:hypothetical protein
MNAPTPLTHPIATNKNAGAVHAHASAHMPMPLTHLQETKTLAPLTQELKMLPPLNEYMGP